MKRLFFGVLFVAAYGAAYSQIDSTHTTTDNTDAKMKLLSAQIGAWAGKGQERCVPNLTRSIYDDSILMENVLKELTWSLSNRGYYVPITTRCDSTSEIKLTLACTWDLWLSYSKRNNISQEEFRKLISSKIIKGNVMYDICSEDFKYLYGRDRVLGRAVAFECDTLPQENATILQSPDIEALMSWAFDSRGYYRRELQLLPYVAYRLLPYGIAIPCVLGTRFYYEDITNRH